MTLTKQIKFKNHFFLDTNIMGTCILFKEAIKVMSANNIAGQIINIILGHHVYNIPKVNIYPASKHAITALTETLRQELIGIDSKIKITVLIYNFLQKNVFVCIKNNHRTSSLEPNLFP